MGFAQLRPEVKFKKTHKQMFVYSQFIAASDRTYCCHTEGARYSTGVTWLRGRASKTTQWDSQNERSGKTIGFIFNLILDKENMYHEINIFVGYKFLCGFC